MASLIQLLSQVPVSPVCPTCHQSMLRHPEASAGLFSVVCTHHHGWVSGHLPPPRPLLQSVCPSKFNQRDLFNIILSKLLSVNHKKPRRDLAPSDSSLSVYLLY